MDESHPKIQREAKDIIRLVISDDTEGAEKKFMAFKADGKANRFTLLRMVIAYAHESNNRIVLEWILSIFERIKSKAPRDSNLYYDVANGYQALYETCLMEKDELAYERDDILKQAIKYFKKAGSSPLALTNLGNLYDTIGSPVEAINYYEAALAIDSSFGMALGNKAQALMTLADVSGYQNAYLIKAHQLYSEAIKNKKSVVDIGGAYALKNFQKNRDRIKTHFSSIGKSELLKTNLEHKHEDKYKDELTKFYSEFCFKNDLYLNLHLSDVYSEALVGDSLFPILRTGAREDEKKYVQDIAFRFNEICESFMVARTALVQSQYTNQSFSSISEQTVLVNNLDYSASNIYVGHLKTAYKEAFGSLDKIAILLNHYLNLGNSEEHIYYHNVWFEDGDVSKSIAGKIGPERWLVGLYLICQELRGSKYSHLRNALAHRYIRVFTVLPGPKGTITFEKLTTETIDLMYKVKCAITYMSLFITRKEILKKADDNGIVMKIDLSTMQNLDLW